MNYSALFFNGNKLILEETYPTKKAAKARKDGYKGGFTVKIKRTRRK